MHRRFALLNAAIFFCLSPSGCRKEKTMKKQYALVVVVFMATVALAGLCAGYAAARRG